MQSLVKNKTTPASPPITSVIFRNRTFKTTSTIGGEGVCFFVVCHNQKGYIDPDGEDLINNVAQGTQRAEAYVSARSPNGMPTNNFSSFAYVFRRGMNIPTVTQPKISEYQINTYSDRIILPRQLNAALDRAISAKNDDNPNTTGRIEAFATKMKNGRYKINITVSINGRTVDAGTIAFAEQNEVLDRNDNSDRNKVRHIANETINIVRDTVASTNNVDSVR
jgi:hypothetical protein